MTISTYVHTIEQNRKNKKGVTRHCLSIPSNDKRRGEPMDKARYMYYIEKEDLVAYIATIGGTLVGYTPAKPMTYDPAIMWPAESEFVTKQGVVIIKHWADVKPDDWAPKNGLAIQSTNQRCYDWAIVQPLVKRVEIPFVERWEMFTPAQLAQIDVPEEPAPAGVMIQQQLL